MAPNTQTNLQVACERHLVFVDNGRETNLHPNECANTRSSLLIRTVGSESNRDVIGGEPTLFVRDTVMVRHVKAGAGCLVQSDLRVHFGPGGAIGAERLEIEWPNGGTDVIDDLDANQIPTSIEGEGITDRVPFNQ